MYFAARAKIILRATLWILFVCRAAAAQDKPRLLDMAPPKTEAADKPNSIDGLIRAANQAARNRDYSTCAQTLEQVVATDPNYRNAWNYLGWAYNALGQYSKAEVALRKAIAVNPADPQAYNNLGQALAFQKNYDEAIPQYLKQIEVRAKDPWAHANLGRVYLLTKQYETALEQLQIAASITPDDGSVLFNLGRAYAKVNQPDKAKEALEKSAALQPFPQRWNNVAYELSVDRLDVPHAKKYAQQAIAATANQMRDTTLDHITREDAYQASRISAYWDTWGWIQFQEGELQEAEKYVKSAWMIRSASIISDHLGQIYQQEGRKADALRMLKMAMATDVDAAETRERLLAMAWPESKIDDLISQGRALLKETRTVEVKNTHETEGFAEFWILLSPASAKSGVKFVTGDDQLRPFEKDLETIQYRDSFPEATEMKLLRRGRLSCMRSSPDCKLLMISSQSVPTDELAQLIPSVAGEIGRVAMNETNHVPKLLKRVQPIYPLLARDDKAQGVVRLQAVIARDGSIKDLKVISGHPDLLQAALEAVRQWKYEPTLLNGKPVEVETTVDVIFQLNNLR